MFLIPNLVMGENKIGYSMSLNNYINYKNDKRVLQEIDSIGVTASWANSLLIARGKKEIYCQPSGIVLNQYNYVRILDEYLAKRPDLVADAAALYLNMVVLFALEEKFPCN